MKQAAALLILVCILLVSCDGPRARRGDGRALVAGERIKPTTPLVGTLSSAADFTAAGNRLYILDWRARTVVRVQQRNDSWIATDSFSREGNGPGELTEPVAIDTEEQTGLIGVLERSGELELFDTAGHYVQTQSLDLPCSAGRIQFTMRHGSKLVALRCFGGRFTGQAADTTYMMIASVAAGKPPRVLASRAVSSAAGDWGSIFVATWPFAVYKDTVVFGTGVSDCLYQGSVFETVELKERCAIPFERYSAPKPKGFDRESTAASRWPDPLPLFNAIANVGETAALLRLVSADSIAFEPIDAPGRYFLVGPLNAFVSCKPAGCLWYEETAASGALRFVSQTELRAAYIRSASKR